MFDLYTAAMLGLLNDSKQSGRSRSPEPVGWTWWRVGLAGLALFVACLLALS
ncbi:MAG: hypothetical protein ACOH2N_08245 [Devosia sp.]